MAHAHRSPESALPDLVLHVAPPAADPVASREESWAGYHLAILVCCLVGLGLMATGEMARLPPEVRSLLDWADAAVCAIFLIDFVISLLRADNKWRYLATWGWIDLLSAIPALNVARWGRAARVLRLLRVIRGIKAARIMLSIVVRYRARNAIIAGGLVVIFAMFAGSFAILQVETDPRSMIKTADDAIWWSLCTITTVGYGDLYPVTRVGRLVAGLLMLTGVSMFGAIAGMLASWFTGATEDASRAEIRRLADEVSALRETVDIRKAARAHSGQNAA